MKPINSLRLTMVVTAINNASVAASSPGGGLRLGVTKPIDMIAFGNDEDKNSLLVEDHNNNDRRRALLNTQYYTQEEIDGYVSHEYYGDVAANVNFFFADKMSPYTPTETYESECISKKSGKTLFVQMSELSGLDGLTVDESGLQYISHQEELDTTVEPNLVHWAAMYRIDFDISNLLKISTTAYVEDDQDSLIVSSTGTVNRSRTNH